MAFTFEHCEDRSALATRAGSRLNVSGSISTRTGRAPARTIALEEAKKLKDVVITPSPGPMPAATSANQRASVPEAHPTASLAPVKLTISRSNASTSGPRMKCCDEQTRSIAARISGRIALYCRCRSRRGTDSNFLASEGEFFGFVEERWVTETAILYQRGSLTALGEMVGARSHRGRVRILSWPATGGLPQFQGIHLHSRRDFGPSEPATTEFHGDCLGCGDEVLPLIG